MTKSGIACLALALCLQTAFASRSLQQLPILPGGPAASPAGSPVPAPAPAPTPALAPAMSPSTPATCARLALENAGQYSKLLQLVSASSEASLLTNILDSDSELATILAPTDAGIEKATTTAGISLDSLLADPERITDILEYHILPSQIAVTDLVDGYSFNTLLEVGDVAQSVTVQGTGQSATIVGKSSSAPVGGDLEQICQFNIIPLDGLLLP